MKIEEWQAADAVQVIDDGDFLKSGADHILRELGHDSNAIATLACALSHEQIVGIISALAQRHVIMPKGILSTSGAMKKDVDNHPLCSFVLYNLVGLPQWKAISSSAQFWNDVPAILLSLAFAADEKTAKTMLQSTINCPLDQLQDILSKMMLALRKTWAEQLFFAAIETDATLVSALQADLERLLSLDESQTLGTTAMEDLKSAKYRIDEVSRTLHSRGVRDRILSLLQGTEDSVDWSVCMSEMEMVDSSVLHRIAMNAAKKESKRGTAGIIVCSIAAAMCIVRCYDGEGMQELWKLLLTSGAHSLCNDAVRNCPGVCKLLRDAAASESLLGPIRAHLWFCLSHDCDLPDLAVSVTAKSVMHPGPDARAAMSAIQRLLARRISCSSELAVRALTAARAIVQMLGNGGGGALVLELHRDITRSAAASEHVQSSAGRAELMRFILSACKVVDGVHAGMLFNFALRSYRAVTASGRKPRTRLRVSVDYGLTADAVRSISSNFDAAVLPGVGKSRDDNLWSATIALCTLCAGEEEARLIINALSNALDKDMDDIEDARIKFALRDPMLSSVRRSFASMTLSWFADALQQIDRDEERLGKVPARSVARDIAKLIACMCCFPAVLGALMVSNLQQHISECLKLAPGDGVLKNILIALTYACATVVDEGDQSFVERFIEATSEHRILQGLAACIRRKCSSKSSRAIVLLALEASADLLAIMGSANPGAPLLADAAAQVLADTTPFGREILLGGDGDGIRFILMIACHSHATALVPKISPHIAHPAGAAAMRSLAEDRRCHAFLAAVKHGMSIIAATPFSRP